MAEIRLTEQQKLAVYTDGGALLVSAAAGSGKTRVLVERVLRCICDPDNPQDISRFLIITYTKAAAAELRGKLAEAISGALSDGVGGVRLARQLSRIDLAQISTVHAFCANILREYAHERGLYPDFRIAEETEAALWRQQAMEETLDSAYESLDTDAERKAFLDQLGSGRDDRTAAAILMQAYSSVQCDPEPEQWIGRCQQDLELDHLDDMGQTRWGKFLMEEFFHRLDEQIAAMERAIDRLREYEIIEAKYRPVFSANLAQLHTMREAASWDALHMARISDFGRLPPIRGEDKALLERLRKPRELCKRWVKEAQEVFAVPSAEALEELRRGRPVIRGMFSLLADFTDRYRAIKQRHRALDFGDLEHEMLKLLYVDGTEALTPAAIEIRERFSQIMVDEYQDSNRVQEKIFRAVSRDETNLFMVGDVKQSIYRFRLADPDIFIKKYNRFRAASSAGAGEPRKVVLSQNFRSGPDILSAVNDVFSLCMSREVGDITYSAEERLNPAPDAQSVDGACVELHCLNTADKEENETSLDLEARLVARRIAQMLRDKQTVRDQDGLRPVKQSDIVILLRSPRSKAPAYLQALAEEGIEAVSDQNEDILQTTEVSVLLSYLQILDNPHQDVPLLSVLLSPLYGYGADTVARVRAACGEGDFFDALTRYCVQNHELDAFMEDFRSLRATAHRHSAEELVRMVCERTCLRDVFTAMDRGAQRLENLQTIYLMAASFDPDGPGRLHDFLVRVEQQRERGITGTALRAPNAVRIMSIHKSKGLEFPVVFLCGLATQFNTEDDRQAVQIHQELGTGCDTVDLEKRIRYPSIAKKAVLRKQRAQRTSEELRVLYVAMTRARDRLIMTYASGTLAGKLKSIADQLSDCGPVSLSRSANSLGHWILMAAMRRGEAGALFALGGQPEHTVVTDEPWLIRLWKPEDLPAASPLPAHAPAETEPLPENAEAMAGFRYPHVAATSAPAKLTATQFKGRMLDRESAEETLPRASGEKTLRQPLFLRGRRPLSPTEQGTAVHLAMQYIDYSSCGTTAGVAAELRRLVEEEYLLPEQAACVVPERITALFTSPLGQRILHAPEVVREFKFSILTDGTLLDPALNGERIMLQGVTDCCLLEPDGLCVIDYKTDRVRPGGERERAEYYRGQLEAYSDALSRIFERPVKEKILYFFATDTAVTLELE